MCVIISNAMTGVDQEKVDSFLEKALLLGAMKNGDGVGVMAYSPKKGVLVHRDYPSPSGAQEVEEILKLIQKYENWCVHFRKRARGALGLDNVHPSEIVVGNRRAYLVHNGVVSGFGDDKVSDTRDMCDTISEYLSANGLDINESSLRILDMVSSEDNKFMVMTDRGEFLAYGEFYQVGNLVFSNTYSVPHEIRYGGTKLFSVFFSGRKVLYKHEDSFASYRYEYGSGFSYPYGYSPRYWWEDESMFFLKSSDEKKVKIDRLAQIVNFLRKREERVLGNPSDQKRLYHHAYYHDAQRDLYLTDRNRNLFIYKGVPEMVVRGLFKSDNPDAYFDEYIREYYKVEYLGKRDLVENRKK